MSYRLKHIFISTLLSSILLTSSCGNHKTTQQATNCLSPAINSIILDKITNRDTIDVRHMVDLNSLEVSMNLSESKFTPTFFLQLVSQYTTKRIVDSCEGELTFNNIKYRYNTSNLEWIETLDLNDQSIYYLKNNPESDIGYQVNEIMLNNIDLEMAELIELGGNKLSKDHKNYKYNHSSIQLIFEYLYNIIANNSIEGFEYNSELEIFRDMMKFIKEDRVNITLDKMIEKAILKKQTDK